MLLELRRLIDKTLRFESRITKRIVLYGTHAASLYQPRFTQRLQSPSPMIVRRSRCDRVTEAACRCHGLFPPRAPHDFDPGVMLSSTSTCERGIPGEPVVISRARGTLHHQILGLGLLRDTACLAAASALCQHASVLRSFHKLGFVVVGGWMLFSPAYVQIFGGHSNAVHAWRMFHKRGLGICSAVYYDHEDRRIDRYALFGLDRATATASFRRTTNEEEARSNGRLMCEKLAAARRPTDVRVRLRCGVAAGLQTLLDREENLCGS
jgi:hypothetical protein